MFEIDESLKLMFEAAAKSLSGSRVYFRAPLTEGREGEAFKDTDGTPAMELLPIEDIERLYKIFLHESGHIILHAEDLETRNLPAEVVAMQEKGIQPLPTLTDEEYAEYWKSTHEIEAREFADFFYGYSKRKAKLFYGEDDVLALLRVCANTTFQKGE